MPKLPGSYKRLFNSRIILTNSFSKNCHFIVQSFLGRSFGKDICSFRVALLQSPGPLLNGVVAILLRLCISMGRLKSVYTSPGPILDICYFRKIIFLIIIYNFYLNSFYLKGTVARGFWTSAFFHQTNKPGPLIHILKYFRIRLRIRRDFRIRSLTDRYKI